MIKIISLSLKNIWRNKVISIATIFVIAIIIFIFNTILAVNYIAKDSVTELGKKIDIIIYLTQGTEQEDIDKLSQDLIKLEGVENISYTSKENALKELTQAHPDLSIAFDKYNIENPLPQSINISTIHPKYHQAIFTHLEQEKYSRILLDINNEDNSIIDKVSKNLISLTSFAEQIMIWLLATFIIGGALIIINAIHITIYNRKKEIQVMKMVGASHAFIKLPYILEAIIYGFLAVTISMGMLLLATRNLNLQGINFWSYIPSINIQLLYLLELAVTITLSAISSLFAVHDNL